MTSVNKRAVVAYTTEQMFKLVDHIEAYPEFLPWCEAATVHMRAEDECKASLMLAHSGIRKEFTTHNRMQTNKMIELKLIDGPFKQLEGFWRFDPLDETSSAVSLDLEFEFSNKLVAFAVGSVFTQVASTMVDAFCQRAEAVYGK